MSYEGYQQLICKNGHYNTVDAYDNIEVCQVCGEGFVWWNSVDVTNGSFEVNEKGEEVRIDGHINLEILQSEDYCTCEKCDNTHIISPAIYKVPEVGGHKT